MLKELIKITNTLDQRGLTKEADYLDAVIRKLAAKPCSAESVRLKGLGPAEIGEDDQTVASQLQRLGAKPIDC